MKLCISVENVKEFRPMAKDIPSERILPYIKEAHQYNLKPLLGDALYYDFLQKFDVSGDPQYANYQALLVGSYYGYGQTTIEHPGLIPYLAYATLARFYNNNKINATKFGLVQKDGENSTQITLAEVQSAIGELRANMLADQADLIKYLTTKGTLYPLYIYQDGSVLGDLGVKFFDPDRPTLAARNGRTLTSF